MSQSITVKDVARAAGVSRQTVSNVVNSSQVVRGATRARVEQAIQELGYTPHASARRLRTQRSSTLAVRIDRAANGGSVLDTFLHALTEQADRQGLRVMLYTATDPADEVRVIERLVVGHDVDAFVLTSTFHRDPRTAWLLAHNQPFVTFGRPWGSESDARYRWVDVDGRAGTRAATRHLWSRGARRIACLGWPAGSETGDERRAGWVEALTGEHVSAADITGLTLESEDDLAAGQAAIAAARARLGPVDAVVAVSDTLALAAWLTLGEHVPVVGFDNTPIARSLGLSSVDQRLDVVAANVLRLVSRDASAAEGVTHYLVEPRLIARSDLGPADLVH